MTTITLYKLHSGFSNVSDNWSLTGDFADETRGDFAEDYILPEGFELGVNRRDEVAIFDADDRPWLVTIDEAGKPALAGGRGALLTLEKAA